MIGCDGHKKILGTKIHVAVEQKGLPISVACGPANEHDSTRFTDVLENVSDYPDGGSVQEIVAAYADKGYDAAYIRDYLKRHGMDCCIPYRSNSKFVASKNLQKSYHKTRFVVERFFSWLKCGFHRTAIRYERNCDNYLGIVYLACIVMYWRVLG